jgi:hypothetical protein
MRALNEDIRHTVMAKRGAAYRSFFVAHYFYLVDAMRRLRTADCGVALHATKSATFEIGRVQRAPTKFR